MTAEVLTSHPILSLINDLLDVPAPSGREADLATLVRRRLIGWGYEPETDPAGNVLVRLPGPGPKLCVASHLDEIGLVVTNVEKDGTLRVHRSGGLYPWKLGEGPLEILGDQRSVSGVLSMGSTHRRDADQQRVGWDDVRVLTGLSVHQLDEAGVRPGSPAVPTRERRGPLLFGDPADPLVGAWTFDDRAGMAMLLYFLQQLAEGGTRVRQQTIIAFTVREEEGGHGAKLLCQREEPALFIAVDGCPMPPGVPLTLDGRPGIWSKDRLAHYDQQVLIELMAAAEAAGTALQPVVYESAASDASLVFAAGAAPRVACFGHVRANSHGYEVARLAVFDHVLATLRHYLT
ncbi:MAG: M20/M25/M40 family metallo-hydrolase [Candidatus Promineifilaceae bacterium]|nr:M20/M25/M40 family metallo-hydrolase [Candidatus Promineifilaceae bacterium]